MRSEAGWLANERLCEGWWKGLVWAARKRRECRCGTEGDTHRE